VVSARHTPRRAWERDWHCSARNSLSLAAAALVFVCLSSGHAVGGAARRTARRRARFRRLDVVFIPLTELTVGAGDWLASSSTSQSSFWSRSSCPDCSTEKRLGATRGRLAPAPQLSTARRGKPCESARRYASSVRSAFNFETAPPLASVATGYLEIVASDDRVGRVTGRLLPVPGTPASSRAASSPAHCDRSHDGDGRPVGSWSCRRALDLHARPARDLCNHAALRSSEPSSRPGVARELLQESTSGGRTCQLRCP